MRSVPFHQLRAEWLGNKLRVQVRGVPRLQTGMAVLGRGNHVCQSTLHVRGSPCSFRRLTLQGVRRTMQRRAFLKLSTLAACATSPRAWALRPYQPASASERHSRAPHFPVGDPGWRVTWDAALAVLALNLR